MLLDDKRKNRDSLLRKQKRDKLPLLFEYGKKKIREITFLRTSIVALWLLFQKMGLLLRFMKRFLKSSAAIFRYFFLSASSEAKSVLAVYDFTVNPYTYNFVEFLANAEVFRVKNNLDCIDVVFVVDRVKKHRGDETLVAESNYRNWILNIAESVDLLPSLASMSIFDRNHNFLDLYCSSKATHLMFPENGRIYVPKRRYHLRYASEFFRQTGFIPRFQSSPVLLDWAQRYMLEKCYPLVPIVVFVRNATVHPARNSKWGEWLEFMREAICKHQIKFVVINDFWNAVEIPQALAERVIVCDEATISTKYRAALTQKCSLVLSVSIGSFAYCIFTDTPYLLFGMDNDIFDAHFNIKEHGMSEDLQFLWQTKYQKTLPTQGGSGYLNEHFEEMYSLLQEDGKIIPSYYQQ